MKKGYVISCITTNHGGEFKNHDLQNFCNNFSIDHQFSSLRSLQQN